MNETLEELYQLWLEASHCYYNTDDPIITDDRFDEIVETLMEHKEYADKMRTKIQSYTDGMVDVKDLVSSMLSLKKFKFKEFKKMIAFLSAIIGKFYYSPKFDGMAIKVTVKDGVKTIISRGGQDFTEYLEDHPDIKNITRPITHGELLITEEKFNNHYVDVYANKRNCILGVMKTDAKHLDFIELTDGVNHLIDSPWVNEFDVNTPNLDVYYRTLKEKLPWKLDGIVISKIVEKQVVKDNYPTNSVALKFPSGTAETTITGVTYNQKKTGALIPVFNIVPTLLDGSTITKATAYNFKSMKTQGIGIGAKVLITKSGDIVPIVDKVLVKSNDIRLPEVEHYLEGVHAWAVDQQLTIEYKFELAFNLLQVDGFGTVLANEVGRVLNFDILEIFNQKYRPVFASILSEINYNKFKVIYDIKSVPLDLVVNMLQFNGCGAKTSKRVATLLTAQKGDIVDTKNLSQNVKDNILRGEGFLKIQEAKTRIVSYGVGVTRPLIVTAETLTFEMTGSPPKGMNKSDFVAKLKTIYAGAVHTTLNKETKVLFVDSYDSNSGKMNKARKYNSKIVSYEDVLSGKIKLQF